MSASNTSNAITTMPTSLGEFSALADRFSKSSLIPADLRAKPEDVFVTLLAGHELGLAPMASLRAIHVVKGKPILSADAMVAIVLGRGACEYFICIEETDASVTYETKRVGAPRPIRATWTRRDAERAKLSGGDNWSKYPRAMLKARCKAGLARDVYPDVLAGCYEESEAQEVETNQAIPGAIDVQVVEKFDIKASAPSDPPADSWPEFAGGLAGVVGDFGGIDTHPSQWNEDQITVAWAGMLRAKTKAEINAAVGPLAALMTKHAETSPRVAALQKKLGEAYKARAESFKAAQKGPES